MLTKTKKTPAQMERQRAAGRRRYAKIAADPKLWAKRLAYAKATYARRKARDPEKLAIELKQQRAAYKARHSDWREREVVIRLAKAHRRKMDTLSRRARRLFLPFDLTVDDVRVPDVCPVLGMFLKPWGSKQADDSPSVDRIIPSRGYVKGNVIVISNLANRLKNNATIDQMVKITKFYTDLTGYYHTC